MNPQYYSLTGYRTTSHILINQGGEIILSGNHWVSFELTAIVQELTGTGEIDWQWMRPLGAGEPKPSNPNDYKREGDDVWININPLDGFEFAGAERNNMGMDIRHIIYEKGVDLIEMHYTGNGELDKPPPIR